MGDEYGPWVPLDPVEVRRIMRDFPHPWWIAGGWALDMFLGRKTREHEDIDVGLFQRDAVAVRSHLREWDVQWALGGSFRAWEPGYVPAPDEDNVWVRPAPDAAWAFQLMLNPGDETTWVYHRVPSITRPFADVILRTGDGIPYLAPEVQLLYKSGSSMGVRPKDQVDFDNVVPQLEDERRTWLRESMLPGHPWAERLR
ncbi:MAG TPA: hypothetical protein VM345_03055 [Acidimicrobiales bacterium]|jgi:hypothetical protein|nr:hypothetical protein [Acidimicrobiales bacterium]